MCCSYSLFMCLQAWQPENLSCNGEDIKISESQAGVHYAEDMALLAVGKWEWKWMGKPSYWISRQARKFKTISRLASKTSSVIDFYSLKRCFSLQ